MGEAARLRTFSGRYIDPLCPDPFDISIVDIAHALSNQCRFGGHTPVFYSVAQHSVIVSNLCDTEDAMWGLLHDASEAYLVDLPSPIKHRTQLGNEYIAFEGRVMSAVCKRFGLHEGMPISVHIADQRVLALEGFDLFHIDPMKEWGTPAAPDKYPHLDPVSPTVARRLFLERFEDLRSRIKRSS